MKSKKSVIIIIGIVAFIVLSCVYFFTKQDKETSFTILEKQWLESNKSKVIDISILKDIPIISYNGSGVLFDFLEDFENVTGLDFNPIAYQKDEEIKSDYSFQVVSQKGDNDILVYSDSYALLTNTNIKYNKLSEIDSITIGVLESDFEKVQSVMDNMNVTLKSYPSIDGLIAALKSKTNDSGETVQAEVNAIVLPRISSFDLIASNDNLNISYNINEIKQEYVIKLGSDEKLNEILTKYFKKWNDSNYSESFNKNFSNSYFSFSGIDDKVKAEFKSKRYVYGYVDNKPYDVTIDNNLYGINKAFLDGFSKVSLVDIEYKNYSNFDNLVNDFNANKVDILFNDTVNNQMNSFVDLVSNYDEQGVVLTLPDNKVTVSSVKSLNGYEVAVIDNTKLASFLEASGVTVKKYSDITDLIDKVKSDTIVVLDSEQYNFYSSKYLSKYKSIYSFDVTDDYTFKVVDNDSNKIFIKFFNFYLSFVSSQQISNLGYSELVSMTNSKGYINAIVVVISLVVVALIALLIYQKVKSRDGVSNKVVVVKDNKIKYIDVLTSLKNRNYLNDNIDSWDESLVYPQGIVIVDLNNIAYINDNYGHSEGDNVIKEAANILIKTQISNTEIIRTNGNEFLIYMVGYDEKQIVSYIRKLSKEFRDLSHNFGAAIGYSIITDEIKTIDDAINEATMDMKNNKQESH